jgi:NAD(P)-dependent dehydrogenase (short-subunit alcohol dehydrogenase family)
MMQIGSNHRSVLITGATAGIGWATAQALARKGYPLLLHGRDRGKLEQRLAELRSTIPEVTVDAVQADFSDLKQVQHMVEQLTDSGGRVDILINNAGGFYNRRRVTELGVEKTFYVNHLASFLLTTQLLERKILAQDAKVVMVTSDAYAMGTINFDDLEFRRGYFGMRAYARSKLANLLFAYGLAHRLQDSEITVNAVHPGHIASDIWKTNFGWFGPILRGVMSWFAKTPEQGAESLIYLATSPEVAKMTGRYFVNCRPIESTGNSLDPELIERLWRTSESLVEPYITQE